MIPESLSAAGCPDRAALEVFVSGGETDGALGAHAAGCPACRGIVAEIREENALLRAYAPPGAAVRVRTAASDFQIRGYDIVRELHRGGQGVVYHALQRSTRRDVAIKVLRAGPFAGLSDRARFDREIQVLAQLNHPNIVAIHDSGVADGSHYFVMDFVRGLPLDDFLSGPGRALGVRDRLELCAQVCEAINAAHLRGIIHRDLKPSNIMVEVEGTEERRPAGTREKSGDGESPLRAFVPPCLRASPKVLDFGLAKLTSTEGQASMMTLTGHFVGTPQWASPEQLIGSAARVDLRSDVYSLGVILYQVLSGEFPYDVSGPWHEVASRIQRVEPFRLRRSGRAIDDDLDTIVMKCLAKEPERRYETAGALARDIRHYLAGEAIDAKRESTWYVLRKTVRRHRLAIGAVVGAFVVLLAFALAMLVAYQRAHRAEQATAQRSTELTAALVQANIEQGRTQGLLGNVPGAEDLLWREFLTSSTDAPGIASTDPAFWALLQLYARYPCRATFRVFDRTLPTGRLTFEQDTGLLVAAGRTGAVTWWELNPPRIVMRTQLDYPRGELPTKHWARGDTVVARFASGYVIDTARDGCVRFLATPPEVRWTGHDISRDGRRLALGDDEGHIHLFAVPDEGPIRELRQFDTHGARVRGIAWLATRDALVANEEDNHATLWNLAADPPEPVWTRSVLGHSTYALSSDDRWIALHDLDSEGIACVRVSDGQIVGPLTEPFLAEVTALEISPDNAHILAGSSSRSEIRLSLRETGQREALLLGHRAMLDSARFSPDGREIMSLGLDAVAKIWELPYASRAATRVTHGHSVMCVTFARQRDLMLRSDGTGRVVATRISDGATDADFVAHDAPVASIALAPDERQIATASYDGTIKLWDQLGLLPQPLAMASLGLQITQISYNANGRLLAAACNDGAVDVWDIQADTHRRLTEHKARIATALFSPDGRWLASGDVTGRLIIRSVADFSVRADIPAAHFRNVRIAAFSPDSRILATGGDDGSVRLWDPSTGTCVRAISGHENSVFALAYRPDGRVIASADSTGVIILWDAHTGRNLAHFKPHDTMVFSVAFSPDGSRLASGSGDGTCVVQDLAYLQTFVAGNLEAAIDRMSGLDPARVALVRRWAEGCQK